MFSSKVIAAAIEILADDTAWPDTLSDFSVVEIRQVATCLELDGADDLAAEIDSLADQIERLEEMGS